MPKTLINFLELRTKRIKSTENKKSEKGIMVTLNLSPLAVLYHYAFL